MKKTLSIILVMLLFVAMIAPVAAATPRFTYTQSIYAYLDIDTTWGVATCVGEVIADNNVPVKLVMYLQVYRNGGWETVKTWESTGNYSAHLSKVYAIYKGYEYRTYCVGYVYNSNNAIVEIVDVYDSEWYT